MWGHIAARDDAYIEAFLAKHYKVLSSAPIEGKACNINFSKIPLERITNGLKEVEEGNEHMKTLAKELKQTLSEEQASLKYLLKTLPEGKTKKAVIELVTPSSEG